MKKQYRYVVIGVGGVGSAAAYWLARRAGAEVLGLEQFELGHVRGGSQDHSRIIRRAYHNSEYTALTGPAYDTWDDVEKEAGETVVFRTGGLNFGGPGSTAESYIQSMRAQNIPHEVLTPGEVAKRWPAFRLSHDMIAAYQADGGLVDAARANAIHVRLARAHGANILDRTPVRSIRIRGASVEIVSDAGTFEAEKVLVASGAWTNTVLREVGLELPLTVTQEQVTYFRSPALQDFSPERFPIWIGSTASENLFYGFPVYGEPATKAGEDAGGRFVTADTRTFEPDMAMLRRLTLFLEKYIPSMLGPIHYTKTCLYTMPPDRNFIIDRLPDAPHVMLCVGAGHIFKFASLVGKILSELAIDGATRYPIAPFRLDREALTNPAYPKDFHLE